MDDIGDSLRSNLPDANADMFVTHSLNHSAGRDGPAGIRPVVRH